MTTSTHTVYVAHWSNDGDCGLDVFQTKTAAATACVSWLVQRFPDRFGGNSARVKRRRERAYGDLLDGYEFEQTDDAFYTRVETCELNVARPITLRP